ncbi:hypothetical protein Tco_1377985 [Tanacetum coccineum]
MSFKVEDRTYTTQAWNRLFRIREQLRGVKRSMSMRQFSLALGRHGANEKVTLDDLFLLHSMDGGEMVDVSWTAAKFLSEKETSLLNVAKLVDLGICKYNGLGFGELMDDKLDNSKDESATVEARRGGTC